VIPERLRHWADGVPAQLAAVEMLVSFGVGRLVDGPWVRPGGFGSFWFDPDVAAEAGGHLSGGERRALAIASSLASAVHPVDLSDAVTGLDPTPCGACSMPSCARADIQRPQTHLNGTTMSPAEALYETSRGPTRSVAFMGRRPDLAETIERRTEDLDETSNCPIALDVVRSPERRPAGPLEGPGSDRQEPSKSPASSKTGAGPGRDRHKTVARPGSDPRRTAQRRLVRSCVVSGLLSIPSAHGTSRTWPQGSVSRPCVAASGACAFRARAGCPRSGPRRAPDIQERSE
jgi:hypothetical protein